MAKRTFEPSPPMTLGNRQDVQFKGRDQRAMAISTCGSGAFCRTSLSVEQMSLGVRWRCKNGNWKFLN
jgi:hypothetical protein